MSIRDMRSPAGLQEFFNSLADIKIHMDGSTSLWMSEYLKQSLSTCADCVTLKVAGITSGLRKKRRPACHE
uniref:Uncharacterized protein n=1 Tax=Oryctolagus cuniculus TaxID=9986 RepID=A0A5F9DRC6_RABIT